jgi:hypothetical protein
VTEPEARSSRYPVGVGDHPEQELVAEVLHLGGRLDLLKITPDGAAIIDFKTGTEDDSHRDQLRLYALLWQLDSTVNPDVIPVTSLVAAYPSHDEAVAVPSANELAALADEISERIETSAELTAADNPQAVIGEHCGVCSVRVLCDAYWERGAPELPEVPDGARLDVEVHVLREHGVKSWVVRDSRSGREMLVRTPAPSFNLPLGKTVRIIGARRIVDPDEEAATIVAVTTASEIYQLTE